MKETVFCVSPEKESRASGAHDATENKYITQDWNFAMTAHAEINAMRHDAAAECGNSNVPCSAGNAGPWKWTAIFPESRLTFRLRRLHAGVAEPGPRRASRGR